MRHLLIATALVSGLALAGCNYNKDDYNKDNAAYEAEGADYNGTAGGGYDTATASNWPEGTRIVEENHVYYRVEPSGTRVRLEPGDSTILVDNGVRYRVDPGGVRVRINDEGAAIRVSPTGVDATVPVSGDTKVVVNTQ
jgi:hypothetical protein